MEFGMGKETSGKVTVSCEDTENVGTGEIIFVVSCLHCAYMEGAS